MFKVGSFDMRDICFSPSTAKYIELWLHGNMKVARAGQSKEKPRISLWIGELHTFVSNFMFNIIVNCLPAELQWIL